MNRCPECGKHASIVGLLTMSRSRPYRCSCGTNSLLEPSHNTIAAMLTISFVVACALLVWPRLGFLAAITVFAGLYLSLGVTMLLFMRLRRVAKQS